MTFPETLRELARLRPEMFKIMHHQLNDSFRWNDHDGECFILLRDDWVATQDDLDSILLKLDRRVLLRESVTTVGGNRTVRLVATIFDMDWNRLFTIETDETEKNPAMQKALTFVGEEIKKGEKG